MSYRPPAAVASVAWSGVTGKPSAFPADTHTHAQGDVTGLTAALAGKAASTHAHAISEVTGLQTALDGKMNTGAVTLTSSQDTLTSGDVTMTNLNQFYTGASLTLAAGTWVLIAHITCGRANTTLVQYTARLFDGTNPVASTQASHPSQNPHSVSMSLVARVTPAGSTTYSLQAAATVAGCLIRRATPNNASGNTATQLVAIKVG